MMPIICVCNGHQAPPLPPAPFIINHNRKAKPDNGALLFFAPLPRSRPAAARRALPILQAPATLEASRTCAARPGHPARSCRSPRSWAPARISAAMLPPIRAGALPGDPRFRLDPGPRRPRSIPERAAHPPGPGHAGSLQDKPAAFSARCYLLWNSIKNLLTSAKSAPIIGVSKLTND